MSKLETPRLILRRFTHEDAPFIVELLNEPAFVRYIGDKQVRSTEDAARYLSSGPMASYKNFGFGLYCVEKRADHSRIGMCGLLKRDTLPDPDLGFAFLERHWGNGFAFESAQAVLEQARSEFLLSRVVAITSLDNRASAKVLNKLGLSFEAQIILDGTASPVNLFA